MKKIVYMIALITALFACGKKEETNTCTGIIEGEEVTISSLTPGTVLRLTLEEGQTIAVNDTVAILDTRDFVLEEQAATAGLKELDKALLVNNAQILQAKQDYDYAGTKLSRVDSLYKAGAAGRQQADDAKQAFDRASAALILAQANQAKTLSGRDRLEVQQVTAQKHRHDAVVTSPVAGTVYKKYVRQGEAVTAYKPLLTIMDMSKLKINVYIPLDYTTKIKVGQPMDFVTEDGGKYRALVEWISPEAEFTPKTILTPETRSAMVYKTVLRVENNNGSLKHGLPVTVTLP